MRILITKDESINEVCGSLTGSSALIRVVDPGMMFTEVIEPYKLEGVLSLQFHDYTPELFDELGLWRSSMKLLSDLDGDLVARFVLDRVTVDTLVIHCVEGRSRSVAIGLAVADYFGFVEEAVKLRSVKRYCPNPHVYDLVSASLVRLDSEERSR